MSLRYVASDVNSAYYSYFLDNVYSWGTCFMFGNGVYLPTATLVVSLSVCVTVMTWQVRADCLFCCAIISMRYFMP